MATWYDFIIIIFSGLGAGVINVMAGGGSLLTLPVLIFSGLPSDVANGTNRVATLAHGVTTSVSFSRRGLINKKTVCLLAAPALIGSVLGALFANQISESLFNNILAVLMVVIVIFIIWNPQTRAFSDTFALTASRKISAVITFFVIGVYGGFIQAGVGIFIILALTSIFRMSLVQSNAYKMVVISLYTLLALGVFIYNGNVNWILGAALAAGNAAGGWIGAQLAFKKGDSIVKVFLVIAVIGMAAKLLFF
ncbi:sulfite exporter TauE/SafE family protein [Tuberibacillus sp. Marseille-P3662]|uniref:sulfite exporter TauE/SafE family protein n=1 Tax=Tuberibacillus sp. Marseille-P3662 TaxID=1965358 RepID=UPI000A1C8FA9|nr:TSUP family transporter [Tuberibacillus sp. Marseille-P3662]